MGRNGIGVKAASKTSIEITFQFNGIQCRERIKLKPTSVNLTRAENHRRAIIEAIENGTFDYSVTFPDSKNIVRVKEPDPLTLGQYLDDWLIRRKKQIKTSTFVGYSKIIKSVNQQIGNIPIKDFRRKHAAEFAASLNCGNKRIGNILSPIRKALTEAVAHEIIESNPLADWSYKIIMPPKKAIIDPFTKEEQTAILAEMEGQHLNLIQFAFWTGLRTSELCAIEWGDVDWKKQTIRIDKAKTQNSEDDETTKTLSSVRDVKLLPPAMNALKHQKQFTYLEGNKIFHNPRTSQPWQGDQSIRKTCWMPAIKKAGVRYRKPYQTRHTFASMCLSAGENLAWVSKMLGHSNVLQTARTYATWIPDSSPDAGQKMVDLFSENVVIKTSIPDQSSP